MDGNRAFPLPRKGFKVMKLYRKVAPDKVAMEVKDLIDTLEAISYPLASSSVGGFPNGDICITARAQNVLERLNAELMREAV
jgi:hypothetical protein